MAASNSGVRGTTPSFYDPRLGQKPDWVQRVQKDLDRWQKSVNSNKGIRGVGNPVPYKPVEVKVNRHEIGKPHQSRKSK